MLPDREFGRFEPGADPYEGITPALRLEDIQGHPRTAKPALSIMMAFTNYRRSQIGRSLECLARQQWTDFEVLVADIGSPQEMESVFAPFYDLLNLTVIHVSRTGFLACPSRGFRALFPMAKGEVWCIMCPEIMLIERAAEYLYRGHNPSWRQEHDPQAGIYGRSRPAAETTDTTYINIRPGFLSPHGQRAIDAHDWHSRVANVEKESDFWPFTGGLAAQPNSFWLGAVPFCQWYCSSLAASATLWEDMPEMQGHASIDFWLMNYRDIFAYKEILPTGFLGYHQAHLITAVSPIGLGPNEDALTNKRAVLLAAKSKNRTIPPPGYVAWINQCGGDLDAS